METRKKKVINELESEENSRASLFSQKTNALGISTKSVFLHFQRHFPVFEVDKESDEDHHLRKGQSEQKPR